MINDCPQTRRLSRAPAMAHVRIRLERAGSRAPRHRSPFAVGWAVFGSFRQFNRRSPIRARSLQRDATLHCSHFQTCTIRFSGIPGAHPAFGQAAHTVSRRRAGLSRKEGAVAGNGNHNALTMRLMAKIRYAASPGAVTPGALCGRAFRWFACCLGATAAV